MIQNNQKQTYFVGGMEESIRSNLMFLLKFSKDSGYVSCVTQITVSLDILDSLNYQSLPVADITEFRKALILEFHKKHSVDIDLNKSHSDQLWISDEYIGLRVERLVSEYSLRLFSCLKLVIKSIVPVLQSMTLNQSRLSPR